MADRVLDPVCGMMVDPDRAAGHLEHGGTAYYFCSKSCVAKFSADPAKYLSGKREPMHSHTAPVSVVGLTRTAPRSAEPFAPSKPPEPLEPDEPLGAEPRSSSSRWSRYWTTSLSRRSTRRIRNSST